MKPVTLLLQGGLLLGHTLAAQEAYLYTFNHNLRESEATPIISSDTAHSILLRRQGVADGRALRSLDEASLAQIGEHGGFQKPLFDDSLPNTEPSRIFVRVSGFRPDHNDLVQQPHLAISNPTQDLLSDFTSKNPSANSAEDGRSCTFYLLSKDGTKVIYTFDSKTACAPDSDGFLRSNKQEIGRYIDWAITRTQSTQRDPGFELVRFELDFTETKIKKTTISTVIKPLLQRMQSLSTSMTIQPTFLILPETSELAKSALHLRTRQIPEEELLDIPVPTSASFPTFAPQSNTSKPHPLPSSIKIPACFTSLDACTNDTNSCSGHGKCVKSGKSSNCYKCSCSRTLARINKDGTKKTVAWGGAACQKKDVSVEFVLFASFGVVMAGLISGAIGMMWSMGGQELPSVIGAGVGGPRATK